MTTDQLTLAQRHLIATATNRLKDEFAGVFAPETIERFIADSLDQMLSTARVTAFVPIFVERFTRDRLRALAKVEGKITSDVPSVLFLCVHNAGRSRYEDWEVADPAGESLERVRQIRDDIGARVKRLALELELIAAT